MWINIIISFCQFHWYKISLSYNRSGVQSISTSLRRCHHRRHRHHPTQVPGSEPVWAQRSGVTRLCRSRFGRWLAWVPGFLGGCRFLMLPPVLSPDTVPLPVIVCPSLPAVLLPSALPVILPVMLPVMLPDAVVSWFPFISPQRILFCHFS